MTRPLDTCRSRVGDLLDTRRSGDHSDSCLLDRFITHNDESAFALLVKRHGGMVLSVCRRVLGGRDETEDPHCKPTTLLLFSPACSL